jgi:hypothetical protein
MKIVISLSDIYRAEYPCVATNMLISLCSFPPAISRLNPLSPTYGLSAMIVFSSHRQCHFNQLIHLVGIFARQKLRKTQENGLLQYIFRIKQRLTGARFLARPG